MQLPSRKAGAPEQQGTASFEFHHVEQRQALIVTQALNLVDNEPGKLGNQ
jgi:hypothetical protein